MTSFKDFIVNNGIVSTAAAITIGFATATVVKSFVADMILPVLFLIFVGGSSKISKSASDFFSQFLQTKEFRYTNFIAELITWLLIVLVCYLVLDYVFHSLKYGFKIPMVNKPLPEMLPDFSQYNPFAPKQQPAPQTQPATVPVGAPPAREIKENYQSQFSSY